MGHAKRSNVKLDNFFEQRTALTVTLPHAQLFFHPWTLGTASCGSSIPWCVRCVAGGGGLIIFLPISTGGGRSSYFIYPYRGTGRGETCAGKNVVGKIPDEILCRIFPAILRIHPGCQKKATSKISALCAASWMHFCSKSSFRRCIDHPKRKNVFFALFAIWSFGFHQFLLDLEKRRIFNVNFDEFFF